MALKSGNRTKNKSARDMAANQARNRLAKRAKRAKFFRDNKKRITYLVVGVILLLLLAFLTPFGPDIYYNNIQNRKFATPGSIGTGVVNDLYKLGRFYSITFRAEKGNEIYDEIGKMYYGFTFTEYSMDPNTAMDKRYEAQSLIERGDRKGPPFTIPESDLPGVGKALYQAAEFTRAARPRQFAKRLFELYLDDFHAEHPGACDPEITRLAQGAFNKLSGRQ